MSRLSQSPLEHLAALERTVALPVVAGDCYDWCRSVNREAIELDRVLQEWAEDHAEVYEEIRAQAMALESRVELLEAEERRILSRWSSIHRRLNAIQLEASRDHGGHDEPVQVLDALREEIQMWVVKVRAHDTGVQQWFVESVMRDQGVKD